MLRQYRASRCKARSRHREGTIPIGTIVYLQDGVRPMRGFTQPPVFVNPWIVESWCGEREWRHCANVRSLRDGRRVRVADWLLLMHADAGFDFQKDRSPTPTERSIA